MNKNALKKYLLALLLTNLILGWASVATAQTTAVPTYSGPESSIKTLLCTPSNGGQNDLYNCITQLYKFAIVGGSIMAVLFIVIAGYIYIYASGNQESIDKAKSIVESSLTALVILFGGYILLKAINPDLIQFKPIQPPSVTGALTCSGCVDLKSMGIPLKPNQGTQGSPTLANKLQQLAQKNKTWQANEVFPPTTPHGDPCHNNGTCADIVLILASTSQNLAQLCTDAKSVGLSIYNEYDSQTTGTNSSNPAFAACGAPQNPSTRTGNNLHVQ